MSDGHLHLSMRKIKRKSCSDQKLDAALRFIFKESYTPCLSCGTIQLRCGDENKEFPGLERKISANSMLTSYCSECSEKGDGLTIILCRVTFFQIVKLVS